MGLFDWIIHRAPKPHAPSEGLPDNGEPDLPVNWFESSEWRHWPAPMNITVGESKYLDALTQLCGPARKHGYLIPVTATLIREPGNPYDKNAIRVEVKGVLVGYVRREIATHLAQIFDSDGVKSYCFAAVLRGGSFEASYLGAHLWLDKPLPPAPCIRLTGVDHLRVPWPPIWDEGEES